MTASIDSRVLEQLNELVENFRSDRGKMKYYKEMDERRGSVMVEMRETG